MTKISDINDNEIRIIGREDRKRIPRWVWLVVGIVAVAIVVLALIHKPQPIDQSLPSPITATETDTSDIWFDNTDETLTSSTSICDTIIDGIHLLIITPINTTPELHVGIIDTSDRDIILAAMAADLRRDNGKIVGAFVQNGEPLSWGLSKKGYCAIIDGRITVGMAENSPLFEQATERVGYFFRQYPSVSNGESVENNPENAAFRRALCSLDGKVSIIACTDRVLMNDFSNTLVKLGVRNAIFLVGGTADGWYRDSDGKIFRMGKSAAKNKKYINYIVFRKQ